MHSFFHYCVLLQSNRKTEIQKCLVVKNHAISIYEYFQPTVKNFHIFYWLKKAVENISQISAKS